MTEYQIGYGKPPVHSRFRKGVCPNPKGRGKIGHLEAGRLYRETFETPIEVNEGGRTKRIAKVDLSVRRWAAAAIKGNLPAAEILIKLMLAAAARGDTFDRPLILTEKELADRLVQGRMPKGASFRGKAPWPRR